MWPHVGHGEDFPVVRTDNVVLAPGRSTRGLLPRDRAPVPARNRHVAALWRIREEHPTEAQHGTVPRVTKTATLLEHERVGLVYPPRGGSGSRRRRCADLRVARAPGAARAEDEDDETCRDRESQLPHALFDRPRAR